jgi:peptidoglycan/xylan/chitin deacetylase (PgdA/CDA1 family)
MGPWRFLKEKIGFRHYFVVRRTILTVRAGLGLVLYYSGVVRLWPGRPRRLPIILMYHSVGGRRLAPGIVVSAKHFEEHVRLVRRRYRPMSLETVVERLAGGQPMPSDAVVITLDDGYRDNYEHALPILKRYECPAIVFVTVKAVETGRLVWPQLLWRWVNTTTRDELRVSWRGRNGAAFDRVLPLGTRTDRAQARSALRKFVAGLPSGEQEDFLTAIARDFGCSGELNGGAEAAMLTWDQLREMRRSGVSVGAHTMTHAWLSRVDADTVRQELSESRRILSDELGTDVRLFAYPFGGRDAFDEDTKRAVVEAGYAGACAAVEDHRDAPVDLRALGRVYVPDEPGWRFALRLRMLETGSRLMAWTLLT